MGNPIAKVALIAPGALTRYAGRALSDMQIQIPWLYRGLLAGSPFAGRSVDILGRLAAGDFVYQGGRDMDELIHGHKLFMKDPNSGLLVIPDYVIGGTPYPHTVFNDIVGGYAFDGSRPRMLYSGFRGMGDDMKKGTLGELYHINGSHRIDYLDDWNGRKVPYTYSPMMGDSPLFGAYYSKAFNKTFEKQLLERLESFERQYNTTIPDNVKEESLLIAKKILDISDKYRTSGGPMARYGMNDEFLNGITGEQDRLAVLSYLERLNELLGPYRGLSTYMNLTGDAGVRGPLFVDVSASAKNGIAPLYTSLPDYTLRNIEGRELKFGSNAFTPKKKNPYFPQNTDDFDYVLFDEKKLGSPAEFVVDEDGYAADGTTLMSGRNVAGIGEVVDAYPPKKGDNPTFSGQTIIIRSGSENAASWKNGGKINYTKLFNNK